MIKIYQNAEVFHVIGVYRPPNSSLIPSFINKIDRTLDNIPANQNVILLGDININGLALNESTACFIDTLRTHNMFPHITIPTRPNRMHSGGTQIDHIWSKLDSNISSGVFNTVKISDHDPNFVLFPAKVPKHLIKTKFRDHSDICLQKLMERISNFMSFFPPLNL